MRVRLKGVHSVKAKLADGKAATYHYAWRGGPRIDAEPGTPEFMRLYSEAVSRSKAPAKGTFFALIAEYKGSAEFTGLSDATKRAYRSYFKLIEDEFGKMPIAALSDPEVRGDFKRWRDSLSATPRKADYAWTTLARILSVAKDRGRIPVNPCERGGRLYSAGRKDAVWTEAHIARIIEVASAPLCDAMLLALWTGQRQGDLLRLPWSSYDGSHISLRQSKTGRALKIPIGAHLRVRLDAMKRVSTLILTNTRGVPWTSDGFRASWGKACEAADIHGLTFHDLRGSAVTRLAVAGCSVPEIAAITGHALRDVETILDGHYLSRDQQLAEAAIIKLESKFR